MIAIPLALLARAIDAPPIAVSGLRDARRLMRCTSSRRQYIISSEFVCRNAARSERRGRCSIELKPYGILMVPRTIPSLAGPAFPLVRISIAVERRHTQGSETISDSK
jgi:hypothetical protein